MTDVNGQLLTLYRYHAWANAELIAALGPLDFGGDAAEARTALGLVDHLYVVARLFRAHLTGARAPCVADRSPSLPVLDVLAAEVAATDRWYLDYVERTSPGVLAEPVAFTFTDGNAGCMSREEMLLHVALHATVHRGEVCRLLVELGLSPPWDTLAVHLHRAEPSRRQGVVPARAA